MLNCPHVEYPLNFENLVEWGNKMNAVVQRERKGYSVYSNTYFYEEICQNLIEVYYALDEIRDRNEADAADKAASIKYGF